MNISDINQKFIDYKLSLLNGELLMPKYKKQWNKQNPTFGYCYIVSEAIYHYVDDNNLQVYCINLGKSLGVHWYLKHNEIIVDYTADQFDFLIDYSKGRRIGFLKGKYKTKRGYISIRGQAMAKYLGLIE